MLSVLKPVLRIVVLTLVGIELIGCFCINSLMFHPVRQYDAERRGYVDIGTGSAMELAVTKPVGGLVLQAPFRRCRRGKFNEFDRKRKGLNML